MSFLSKILSFFGFGRSVSDNFEKEIPRDDYAYNEFKIKRKKELDRILDKISKKGIEGISKKEKEFLDRESQNQ